MRVLMPSIVDPRQQRGGAWTATRGLLRLLELAWPGAEVDCIPVSSRWRVAHRVRQVRCILQSAVGGRLPAKVAFSHCRRTRRRLLESVEKETPDLVILNGSDLLCLLPLVPRGVKVLLIAHNIEHELYAEQISALAKRWPLFSEAMRRDWQRLREFEWAGMQRANNVLFLSGEDEQTALAACPEITSLVIPPVFDYQPLARHDLSGETLNIGMFADFSWWPNLLGLRWFVAEVWPSVKRDVRLHLFGHASDKAAAPSSRAHIHGFVDDPRKPFRRCDLMIAPMVSGAGVKVKVAEAIYNRVPVLATSGALRGLPAGSVECVKSCDTADEWIAFLNSAHASALARRTVPDEAASHFAPHRSAAALRRFLGREMRMPRSPSLA